MDNSCAFRISVRRLKLALSDSQYTQLSAEDEKCRDIV